MSYRKTQLHSTPHGIYVISSNKLDYYDKGMKLKSFPIHALTKATTVYNNIFGTGLSNGSVITYSIEEELKLSNTIMPSVSRPVSCLEIQNNEIFIGFERARNEASVIISNLQGTKLQEYGSSEQCASGTWINQHCVLVGANNKFIRMYDLRSQDPVLTWSTKAVYNLQKDPFSEYGFISCNDDAIKIWDTRSIQDMYTLNFRNCQKIEYSKSRSKYIGALSKDTKLMKFWDIHEFQSEEQNILKVYKSSELKFRDTGASSFGFGYSNKSNKHILYFCNKHATSVMSTEYDLVEQEIWDDENCVMSFKYNQAISTCTLKTFQFTKDTDITHLIKDRIEKGYGASAIINARILSKVTSKSALMPHPVFSTSDDEVAHLWEWIAYLISMKDLEEFKYIHGGLVDMMNSNLEDEEISLIDAPFNSIITSSSRLRALLFLGYPDSESVFSRSLEELSSKGYITMAAGRYFFASDLYSCTNCLVNSKDTTLQLVGTVILGFSYQSSASLHLHNLLDKIECPFLQAILTYLYTFNWHNVLKIKDLPLVDKLYIAMRYLDNDSLEQYLKVETEERVKEGSLFGLYLTGLASENAIQLLQHYIDNTGDLQTAVLASLQIDTTTPKHSNTVKKWIQLYRTLLNQWEYFEQRASFDIIYGIKYPDAIAASQVHLKCQYCGLPLLSSNQFGRNTSRFFGQRQQQQVGHPIRFGACSNCGQSLPLCSLCSLPVDTNTLGLNTEQFYVWCQQCKF